MGWKGEVSWSVHPVSIILFSLILHTLYFSSKLNCRAILHRATLKERLAHANQLLGEITDSADRPFEVWLSYNIAARRYNVMMSLLFCFQGNRWWQTGDYPWQVLACCMEITDAIRSGNTENFICHIPVHQVRSRDPIT